jgi:adenylyltransferase/sulfurtransferase
MRLDPGEIRRYSRHLVLPEVGREGQERLKEARVLVVGAGGLGAPLALYLAAAGVGTLGLVDFDVVDFSNLQRQILYGEPDVGRPKLEAAARRLGQVNPHVHLELHETRLDRDNALDLMAGYDVISDGTDNFATRYLVNDACALLGKPNVHGSILRFEGQASVFWAARGPCYRCLFPDPPPPGTVPSCAEGGVLGALPGIIGSIQAMETIKLLLGVGETLLGRLLVFDGLAMDFRSLKLRKDPDCPLCGTAPRITALQDYDLLCGMPAADTATGRRRDQGEMTVTQLKARLEKGTPPLLLDVREAPEVELCRLPGAVHIPLGELPGRLDELARDGEIVAYCKMGGRSAYAAELLRRAGFARVMNLAGGIDAWAEEVDPGMLRY